MRYPLVEEFPINWVVEFISVEAKQATHFEVISFQINVFKEYY